MGSEDRFKVFGIPFDNIDNFANSEILSVKAIFDMALILFEKNYGENDLAKFFEREKNLEKMAFLSQTGFTNLLFSFLQNESVLIRKQAIQIFTNSVQVLKILANIRRKFGKSELAENSLIDKMNVILSKELNLDNERILVLEIQKMAAFFDLGEKANLVLQNRQIENCVVNFLLGILTLPFKNIWATAKNTLISILRKEGNGDLLSLAINCLKYRLIKISDAENNMAHKFSQMSKNVSENLFGILTETKLSERESFQIFDIFSNIFYENFERRKLNFLEYETDTKNGNTFFVKNGVGYSERKNLSFKILGFLKTFAKFSTFFDFCDFEEILNSLLIYDDWKIQSEAIKCLSLWKKHYLEPIKNSLLNTANPKFCKSELALISSSNTNSKGLLFVSKELREDFYNSVFRLLLPSFFRKENAESKKRTMLVFLSNLGENDLNPFINLIFAHLNAEKLNKTKNGKIEHKKPNLNKITKILTDFAKYFKKETKVHFGRFFDIAQTVFVKVLNGDEKKTKSLIFSLLIDYLDNFIDDDKKSENFAKMANLAKMALGKISKNDYSKMEKGKRKDVLDFLLKFSKKKNGVNFLVENKTIFGICCKIIENRQKSDFDNDKQNKDRNLKFCYKNDYLDCAFEILTNIFDFYNENNNIPKNIKTETPKILFAIFSRIKSIKNEKSKIHKEIDLILKLFNFLEIEDDFRRTTLNLLQILDYEKLNFRISKNFRETTFDENSCEESRLDKIVNCILTANSKIDDKNISLKLWTFLSNNIEKTENLSKTAKRIKILSGGLNFDSIGDFVEGLCSFITVGKIDPEIDYERRTKTYFEIKKEMPNLMKSEKVAITPCLNLFFRDLNSDDFGLRNQAVIVIKDICRFLKNDDENIKIENGNKNDIKNSIKKMIVNGLSLKNSKLETKMACMEILRQMLEHKNGVFGDLAKLLNVENEDLDFFVNFFHIQTHRRRKAILQLQKMAKSCFSGKSENGENSKNGVSKLKNGFSSESVSKVLVPLLLHHIINSNAKTISLREEGLKTLTPLSSFLEWNSTMKWSNFFFKKLKENLSNEKTFVSCICAIIESSQFENSNNLAKINFDKNFFRNIVVSLIDRNLNKKQKTKDLQNLSNRLKSLIRDRKNRDLIRSQVAVAVIKLCKIFSQDEFRREFSNLVIEICSSLKSRQLQARNEARFALNQIIKIAGANHIKFALGVMKKVLLKGYQKHVLGYSLNSLLSSILEWAEKGSLDDFAPNLVQILLEDIFGRPSEDRSVEKIKYSMKEASSEKSFDSFRILAKMVNFRQSEKGLNLILDNVQKTFFKKYKDSEKANEKNEKLTDRIISGIEENDSVKADVLVQIISVKLSKCFREKNRIDEQFSKSTKKPILSQEGIERKITLFKKKNLSTKESAQITIEKCNNTIELFLKLLFRTLSKQSKNLKINNISLNTLSTPLIQAATLKTNPKFSVLALKTFVLLCRTPDFVKKLVAHKNTAQYVAKTCFQNIGGSNKELTKVSFAVLSMILGDKIFRSNFRAEQMAILIDFARSHIISSDKEQNQIAFSFLNAILLSGKSPKGLFVLMDSLEDILVQSFDEIVRKKCSKCIVTFLSEYTLDEKRLQSHIQKLLSNLTSSQSIGRRSVAETLLSLLPKLVKKSPNVFESYVDIIFFPIVTTFANEENEQVSKVLSKTIKQIFKLTKREKHQKFINCALKWLSSDKKELILLSLKIFLIVISSEKRFFEEESSRKYFEGLLTNIETMNQNFGENWKILCLSLLSFGAVAKKGIVSKDSSLKNKLLNLWKSVLGLIENPHFWVRNAALKLVSDVLPFFDGKEEKIVGTTEELPMRIAKCSNCNIFDAKFGAVLNDCYIQSLKYLLKTDFDKKLIFKKSIAKMAKFSKKSFEHKQNFRKLAIKLITQFDEEHLKFVSESVIKALFQFSEKRIGKKTLNKENSKIFSNECHQALDKLRSKIGNDYYLNSFNIVSMAKIKKRNAKRKRLLTNKIKNPKAAAASKVKENKRKRALIKRNFKRIRLNKF